jgi:hypothetical protein
MFGVPEAGIRLFSEFWQQARRTAHSGSVKKLLNQVWAEKEGCQSGLMDRS